MIGKTISHYKILEKLGEGGMGVVYKAEDMKLDRFVALKFLPRGIEADDAEQARFLQEAKAASALNHPNVCVIHDIQEVEDQQFIVMEYVDGVTLREKITIARSESPLRLKDVIEWAIQIGDALKEAHSKGIIHRDIKTDNIMINEKGQVKVMDFGLAKLKGSLKLTKTSSTVGTLAYMSPEQLKGETTDARMDIFSFGVVLYEMLAGKLPFKGEYDSALMYSILNTEPEPVTTHRPGLSSGFIHLLDRVLEKDPDDRYQSVNDMVIELKRLKRDTSRVSRKFIPGTAPVEVPEETAPTVPAAAPLKKRTFLYPVIALLAMLLVAAAYLLWRGIEAPSVPKFTNSTKVTQAIGVEDYPTWSPEGRQLAYQSDRSGNRDIWVTQVGEGIHKNLTEDYSGNDGFPSWSPDGSQIAFFSRRDGGGCFIMSALGGNPRKVAVENFWAQSPPQWSTDGNKLACVCLDSTDRYVEIVSLQRAESRKLRLFREANHNAGWDLSWSPDGRFFAYIVSADRSSPTTRLWVLRAEDGVGFPVTDGNTRVWSPSWSQDGSTLYFVSNRGGSMDLWQYRVVNDGKPIGSPQRLTTGLFIRYARFSPDGRKLVCSQGRMEGNLWHVPVPKSGAPPATWEDARQVTFDQAKIGFVDMTPDGKKLVLDSDRDGKRNLWVLTLPGGEMQKVITDHAAKFMQALSSDGREIAFTAIHEEKRSIWVVPVGGGPSRRLTQDDVYEAYTTWSPDGQEIAYQSNQNGNSDIWIVPVQGGEARQLTVHPALDVWPDWSPDGQWILFTSDRIGDNSAMGYGRFKLWKIPPEGGKPVVLTETGARTGNWSPDGKNIYYTAYRDGDMNIWEVSAEGSDERQVTDLAGKYGTLPYVRPAADEQHIYFLWHEDIGDIWVMDVVEEE